MADVEQDELEEEAEQLLQGEPKQESSPPPMQLGPFVTFREPVAEISSLLRDIYLDKEDDGNMDLTGTTSIVAEEIKNTVQLLQSKVRELEEDCKTSSESAINREESLRGYVYPRFEALEETINKSLKQMEWWNACLGEMKNGKET